MIWLFYSSFDAVGRRGRLSSSSSGADFVATFTYFLAITNPFRIVEDAITLGPSSFSL
jgi:hypothetical protein